MCVLVAASFDQQAPPSWRSPTCTARNVEGHRQGQATLHFAGMSPPRLPVRLGLVVVLLCVVCSGSASSTDDLSPPPHTTETLHLDATADGAVVAKFEFTFSHPYHGTPGMPAAAQHRLFRFVGGGRRMPAGLAAVVNTHHVHELALSLAAGVWDDAWGVAPAPAGAQLQLWLGTTQTTTTATATTSQDSSYAARVSHIVESLSALYCASIGLLRPQDFVSPLSTPARPVFAPRSPQLWRPCDDDDSSSPSRRLSRSRTGRAHRALCPVSPLHATLPREGLCTENLTPMLRMLPCRAEAGLATLLNPLMFVCDCNGEGWWWWFVVAIDGLGLTVARRSNVVLCVSVAPACASWTWGWLGTGCLRRSTTHSV